MPLNRQSFYLLLWVLTPLLTVLASKTTYPNQIYVCYELLEVGLCALFFRQFVTLVRSQLKWLTVLLLYAVVFIIVSYYGVDFPTSVEYGVFYLPLIVVLEFFAAYSVGYLFDERRTFKYLMGAALALMAYTLLQIQLSPDADRFVSSLSLPMSIPVFIYSGQALLAFVCMIVLLLSLKKTIVVTGGVSLAIAYVLKPYVQPGRSLGKTSVTRTRLLATLLTSLLLLVASGVILAGYSAYLSGTIARFSEEEDVSRSSIALYSVVLLAQHFPQGIGWFGFLSQSIGVISYDVIDARGDLHSGANLHSSYMTWALEGGAPIVLIILYLFWKLFGVIRSFFRTKSTRVLGATLLIWLLSGMIYGAFQQWHSSGTFWGLFGFAFGCYERYRAQRCD